MKKKWFQRENAEQKERNAVLILLAVSFLVGGLVGCFLGTKLSSSQAVSAFLEAAKQQAIQPALWREIWVIFRWPAAAVLLSVLPQVGLTIPALLFLRGFLLAYGITSLVLNASAAWCAFLLFGPTCLLTLPVLFVLAEEALLQKTRQTRKRFNLTLRTLFCLPVLVLCVFLDQVALPPLLTWYLA